jgi:tRNA(Ile)-lysidine synthase
LRGAGIKGASAMPLIKTGADRTPAILRPLLDCPRSRLLEYAQRHDLKWVEDESNSDEGYPRNFIRHSLLPLLECQFPAYRETLSRSAQHFAEAAELLDELAQRDAQDCLFDNALAVSKLRLLSRPRARNLLRYFLSFRGAGMPHAAQLDDLLNQLCGARDDAAVCVEFGEWQVRRYQDHAYVLRAPDNYDHSLVLMWQGETELKWPALNMAVAFRRMWGEGLCVSKLQRAPVTLRVRRGGESLRPAPRAARRSLKNLLQEHKIPPWMRERIPLLYCGDELVSVLGVAIADGYQATESEEGVLVSLE